MVVTGAVVGVVAVPVLDDELLVPVEVPLDLVVVAVVGATVLCVVEPDVEPDVEPPVEVTGTGTTVVVGLAALAT